MCRNQRRVGTPGLQLLLLLFMCCAAQAVTITWTIDFTNRTVAGDKITVTGNVRTFTNNVSSSPASYILTNSALGSATNYFNHVGGTRYSGVTIRMTDTNRVVLIGDSNLTVSITGTYAVLTGATNSGAPRFDFNGPFDALDAATRTNQASEISYGLKYSTNAIATNSPAMANFLNTGPGAQTITNKTFTNTTLLGPAIANARMTNGLGTNQSFLRAILTNGFWEGVFESANGITYTNAGGFGFVFGNSLANTNQVMRYKDVIQVTPEMNTNQFIRTTATTPNIWDLRTNAPFYSPLFPDGATNNDVLALANGGYIQFDEFAVMVSPYQVMLYTVDDGATDFRESSIVAMRAFNKNQFAYQPGAASNSLSFISGGRLTNAAVFGVTNAGVVQHTVTNITTLANGNNTLDPGLKRTLVISGNTTAATLISMLGGADGREVVIVKTSGASLIIANDSGLDGTVANRFYTGTGADVTYTNVPVVVPVLWVPALSRWVVERAQ